MGRCSAGNNADPQRLERILDAKQRTIGVDVHALNAQVEERQRAQATKKAVEQQYAETSTAQAAMMTLSQLNAAAVKKHWDKEVQDFRSTCQGKPKTREWDLNRPDAKQLDLPARQGDNDARCGPASLQKFAGEDLSVGERTSAQMEQCKAWWDEQLATKEAQTQQEQQQRQALATTIKALDSLQCSMMSQEAAARAQLQAQVAAANKGLRELQAAKKVAEHHTELQDKLAELEAAAASPWLNEDPQQAVSAMSPARVRKDHWKGMSQEQREAILQQQVSQVEARKAAAAAAASEEAAAAAAQRSIHKAIVQQALSADAFKRKQAEAAAAVLKEQMAAKAAKDAAERELYANEVTEDYFQQFGTSHR